MTNDCVKIGEQSGNKELVLFHMICGIFLLLRQSGLETCLTATGSCIKYDPAREWKRGGSGGENQTATPKMAGMDGHCQSGGQTKCMAKGSK